MFQLTVLLSLISCSVCQQHMYHQQQSGPIQSHNNNNQYQAVSYQNVLPQPVISQLPYHYPTQQSHHHLSPQHRLIEPTPTGHQYQKTTFPKKRIIISGHPSREYVQTEPFPMPHPQARPSKFSSRSGLSDFFQKFRGGPPEKKSDNLPPAMRDMHRVPKPPKYPLYDLDSISMATPPPAPIMHPMSSLPSDDFPLYSTAKENHGTSSSINRPVRVKPGSRPNPRGSYNARRGPPPSHNHKFSNKGPSPSPPTRSYHRGRGPPPSKSNRGKPPSPHHHNNKWEHPRQHGQQGHGEQNQEYIPSPMASNIEAIKTSPALGRPLDFNEYMAKPSHSYVNDPWNFDPFANQMNQGLNTHALKYNYDPLGMNNLEMSGGNPSMSHLDPTKLSFPGDSFVKDSENNNNNNVPPKADWGGSASQQIQYTDNNRNNFNEQNNNYDNRYNQNNENNRQNNFNQFEQPSRDQYRQQNEPYNNQNQFSNNQRFGNNQNQFGNNQNNGNNFGNNGNNDGNSQNNFGNAPSNGNNFGNSPNNFGNNGNNFGNTPNNFGNNGNNFGNNGNNFGNSGNNFGNSGNNGNGNNFANNENNYGNNENVNNGNYENGNTDENGKLQASPSNQNSLTLKPTSKNGKIEFTIETSTLDKNHVIVSDNNNDGLSNVYDPYSEQYSNNTPYVNSYASEDEATPTDMLPPVDQMHTNFYANYPMLPASTSNNNNNNNNKRKKRRNLKPKHLNQFNSNLEGIHIFNDLMNNQFKKNNQIVKGHVVSIL